MRHNRNVTRVVVSEIPVIGKLRVGDEVRTRKIVMVLRARFSAKEVTEWAGVADLLNVQHNFTGRPVWEKYWPSDYPQDTASWSARVNDAPRSASRSTRTPSSRSALSPVFFTINLSGITAASPKW